MLLKLVFEDLNEFVDSYRGKLSLGGMEYDGDTFYAEGTVLDLNITLNDDLILVRGKALVARSTSHEARFLSILRFLELDDSSVDLIERMTERAIEAGIGPFDVDRVLVEPYAPSADADAPTQRIDARSLKGSSKDVYSAVTSALEVPNGAKNKGPVKKTSKKIPPFLILFVIAFIAGLTAVAVVIFFFPGFLGESTPPDSGPEVVETPAAPATPVTTDTAVPESEVPAQVSDLIPTQIPTVIPTALPTPLPSPTPASRATVVTAIDWASTDQGTVVTLTGDGIFNETLIRHSFLTNDPGPRHLVRLIGIGIEGVRFNTRVHGERLERIRLWPHKELNPPELYLVLDLARPDVKIEDISFEGLTLVIWLGSS